MSVESEGGLCPLCEAWAEDYEPGVSAVKVDGVWYHPSCAESEGLLACEESESAPATTAHQRGHDWDQLLDGFKELDAQRERQLQAEFDVEEVSDDEPWPEFTDAQLEAQEAAHDGYYSDLGVES